MKLKKQLTNKHMATFFFLLSVFFFVVAAWNKYTWNFVMGFYCLILSTSFKTWELINYAREEVGGLKWRMMKK